MRGDGQRHGRVGQRGSNRPVYMTEALLEIETNYNILEYLTGQERATLLERAVMHLIPTGAPVFSQGECHEGIFLIQSGRVRTYYVSSAGREITLAQWTPGHFVGGPEIFGGSKHLWSAVTLEDSCIAFLAGRHLRRLMFEMPNLAFGLVDGLVYKGKCYSALLQILGTRSAAGRLAHLLLTLAEREGALGRTPAILDRRFSHEELATMIGATRQWVTASLKRFGKAGLIRLDDQRIVLLDVEALRATCE